MFSFNSVVGCNASSKVSSLLFSSCKSSNSINPAVKASTFRLYLFWRLPVSSDLLRLFVFSKDNEGCNEKLNDSHRLDSPF